MQYYITEPNNKNTNNKLNYILKKNKLDIIKNDDIIQIKTNEINNYISIYHSDNKAQFLICENDNNLSKICEEINFKIDDYECVEDVIYFIINLKKNIIEEVEHKKDFDEFNILLEETKKKFIQDNKSNQELNSKLKLFSLRSYVEMIGDQIIKIYLHDNFDVNIENFPNIKILMGEFTFKNATNLKIIIDMKINLNLINQPPTINITSNKILKDNILQVISKLKPFSDINSWSVKYSINETVMNIFNMIDTFGEIKLDYVDELDEVINDLEYLLSIKNQNISDVKLLELFDKDLISKPSNLPKSSNSPNSLNPYTSSKNNNNYWKKGTGYGHEYAEKWDFDKYVKSINDKKNNIGIKFNQFIQILSNKSSNKEYFINYNNESIEKIINLLVEYIENEVPSQDNIIIICSLIDINFNRFNNFEPKIKYAKLFNLLKGLVDEEQITHTLFSSDNKVNGVIKIESSESKSTDPFVNIFKNFGFAFYPGEFKNFYYKTIVNINSEKLLRLKKEFNIIKKSITINSEASIFFWIEKNTLNKMRFIITGPSNTPYEQGLYLFDLTLPNEFPSKPPLVHFSNHGSQRFNPNLYNCGKVCLSLLGTWQGEKGESWNSLTSSIFQIIVSIQSQILIEEPYFNEPSYEKSIGTVNGITKSKSYNDNIRQYNLDYAMNGLIEGIVNKSSQYPEFDNLISNYFKFKKDNIIGILEKWENEYTEQITKDKFKKSKLKFIELANKL